MTECEVLIVGGGPAGSTAAWKLVEAGFDVIILDKSKFPRLKLCAGWITPRVIKDLEIDINQYPYTIQKFNRLNYYFFQKLKLPIPTVQFSIRRYEFDDWLLKRSETKVYHHKVTDIKKVKDHFIIDDMFRSKYLVGAGGTHCPVYRTFFSELSSRNEGKRILALEEEFPYQVVDARCHLWMMENKLAGYSWYVPKGRNYLNVGIGGTLNALRSENNSIKYHWELLVNKLKNIGLINNFEFHPRGYNYYLRDKDPIVQLDNIYLVGDAVGLATIDMGEGIGPSVQSGILAAEAIINQSEYSVKSISKFSIPSIIFGKFISY
ncbi:geranylgeranyl reductase [hydrothermal vent metagenome]|uniref:Geranylgeranyl reductase n=1 Tax=hydrothermal vent metagenome TaxID=652676 RepID=A0A3B1BZZ3_9ZZZZ